MLTTIPFSGFYETWHDHEMDRAIEQMVSDDSGDVISQSLFDKAYDNVDWAKAHAAYAKTYAEHFAFEFKREFGIILKFESMTSPREYNFTTDRIFCTIAKTSVRKLFRKVNRKTFEDLAIERFTSCSGFISFYSNDVAAWGKPETYDHNQVGTLVAAAVRQAFDDKWEDSLIENFSGNGVFDDIVYSAMNEEGKRAVRIASYLRERAERKYRKPRPTV